MRKAQWETALHDTNELTRLAEWSRSSGLNARDHAADAKILSDGFGVDQPHYLERLTPAVIAANNKSAVGAPLLHQVEGFVPELAGLAPLEALEKLEARFEADASAQNGLLLQAAMNRITTSQMPDERHLKAVNRVAKLFSVEDTKNSPPLTDDIWYKAYEHADFGGRSVFENMTPGWGYWRRPDFGAVGMNDMISSIAYNSSLNEVGGSIVLFEHARYFGCYQNYPIIPGQRGEVHYVGNDFNDVATSALIIRRFANENEASQPQQFDTAKCDYRHCQCHA